MSTRLVFHHINQTLLALILNLNSLFYQICLLTLTSSEMSGLDECGHRFCNPYWTEYLTLKILSEGTSQTISCAAQNCDTLIDDITVIKLVTDSKIRTKYLNLITNCFVQVFLIL